ncbi:MAG: hypothetical protein ACRCX8_10180 [Sarcina sp.]
MTMKINGVKWDDGFYPSFTPQELLEMGIFGGKYFNNIKDEFPSQWFENAKLVEPGKPANPELNFFKVNASLTLSEWKNKGWIYAVDPNGWMQWYFHYFLGRRDHEMDAIQIHRWDSLISRHMGQINKKGSYTPKQGQTLLHWAYDVNLNRDQAKALFKRKFNKIK